MNPSTKEREVVLPSSVMEKLEPTLKENTSAETEREQEKIDIEMFNARRNTPDTFTFTPTS